ncbi:MAG: 3-hydroxyacyl-CoA dehydrogenase NAD-binding domain-containing protein [Candidatus Longimicrobiales bacterium M2_2A_002]
MPEQTSTTAQAALTLEIESDGVAWIVFDNPEKKVNILSTPIMERLDGLLGEVEEAAAAGRARALIVRSGKDGTFIAGADVGEIEGITDPSEGEAKAAQGQAVFQRLHALEIPTVAAVDGRCLGGGTELILACDVRIASDRDDTEIGLPEIKLGILPGFGGTTRLPRLVGLPAALDIILAGKSVSPRKASKIGVIHERMHQGALYDRAEEIARELADGGSPPSRTKPGLAQRLAEATPAGRAVIFRQARKQVMKNTKGKYPAPLKALEVMKESAGTSLEEALAIEARALGALIVTDESKNLIHVYHLMEGARKGGPDAEPRAVKRVGVLGAGVMGGGIAQLLAYRDFQVRLKDIEKEALSEGLQHARSMFDKLVSKHKLDRREADRYMDVISPSLDYSGFGTVGLVIEAVVERMDVKKSVLKEMEAEVGDDAVLTSNTSSLSITEMASGLERPENFAGMHFFNPVHKMPLVEVIRGEKTSDEAAATVFDVAVELGKKPVLVNDGPGFLVNRILTPYLNEAGFLLGAGASIAEVDEALKDFGMPMGPFRLLDEVGLDIARHAGQTMEDAYPDRMASAPALVKLGDESDRLGKKNESGFYVYEDGKEQHPDPTIYDELGSVIGDARTSLPQREVVDRCVLPMINEAARILDEGIARSPGDVDLAMITGTGFPPFRGGLLRYADSLGVRTLVAKLESFEREFGARYAPAELLLRKADAGEGFYD